MKIRKLALALTTVAFGSILGACSSAPAGNSHTEANTGTSAEALSSYSGIIVYYSDASETTIVGSRAFNCNGGSSFSGRRTRFAQGELDSCGTTPLSYGCIDSDGNCIGYDQCVNC